MTRKTEAADWCGIVYNFTFRRPVRQMEWANLFN